MLSFLLRYSNPTHPSAIINAGLVRFAAGSISYSSVLDFVPCKLSFWVIRSTTRLQLLGLSGQVCIHMCR